MKYPLIFAFLISMISCDSRKNFEHKTYGDFSIGITKDSVDNLFQKLTDNNSLSYSTVSQNDKTLAYVINSNLPGKNFYLYPRLYTTNDIVYESFFFITTFPFLTDDDIKDAKPNTITYYPLISKQQAIEENENIPGYEEINKSILDKLSENYGTYHQVESYDLVDMNKVRVGKKVYKWKNIDGIMNIELVIWATERFCYECTNVFTKVAPEEQKFYSRAKMYLTYYLNEESIKKLQKNKKNEF